MDEYKKFLADRLLSDEQPITYRLLSRALGIHVNTAKEMLYDYHTYQNGIKAESIHATYVVYGTKTQDSTAEDGDVEMGSSMPEHEPLSETVPTTTLALVRQENLEEGNSAALAEYQEVVSIHMYSLAPGPQRDVSLLYDVAKSLAEYTSKEDPLTAGEKYGTIRNLNVRRRDRQARPKPGSYTTSQPTKAQPIVPVKSEPSAAKKPSPFEVAAAAAKLKKQPSSQTPSSSETPTSSAAKPTPALKRGGSGSIMQSFAKAKPPKPKPEPKKEEDTEMALSDDGEADDEDIAKEKAEYKDSDAVRKSRKQREEELRRMMEDDDEEEKSEEEPADEEMEEAPEPEPEPEEEPKEKEEEPAETTTTITNGRRRGKRKVMKKERVMDEQGYLVTIQKPGWESFSEDEAPPPKKPAIASSNSSTPASSAGKAKKSTGKGAQGNIMSFFAKKS
ncbi:unnamed protein product [Clonostachys rosea f. rosea IK726]|uniref:Uncharacterized protein n=1 Tax=Clonostachys rosea f. rosea IK726 TaxID=1349383 RepID=A0ACA9U0K8_BIOOC|nr:unnamed protein product [Clonostachys rosea f. rosea IK726]